MAEQKSCFVVMGFGEKTDYKSQRRLNLDKTYRGIIKPAVEACDMKCVRADDIIHSGVIDRPMYEQLLGADLVVADLSTSNENAIYELGVRHALRPNTTIIIAEEGFSFPFDLASVLIRTYKHLGTGIDFEEAERMRDGLSTAIRSLVFDKQDVDSPVYTFLPHLSEPLFRDGTAPRNSEPPPDPSEGDKIVFGALLEKAQEAMAKKNFPGAKLLFGQLHKMNTTDAYVVQQLALATYKDDSGSREALLEARDVLQQNLSPQTTNDPETLGLWGAVHKRLWDKDHKRADLDTAIWSYERGYYLKRDYYNGMNYAFMLNVRAPLQAQADETIADKVLARRVRSEVLGLIDQAMESLPRDADRKPIDAREAYWIEATRLEAMLGLGQVDAMENAAKSLFEAAPAEWMPDSTRQQLAALKALL